jgi:hypothetical protein
VEAVAIIVQIHLQQNRTDLALKEVQAARRWAQDSLLVNIAESWVGLRMVRLSSAKDNVSSLLNIVLVRVGRSTNKRSTSSKKWHKRLQQRHLSVSSLKL